MITRLSAREQNILIVCTVLVTAYFSYHFMIMPLKERSENLDRMIEAEIREIKKYKQAISMGEAQDTGYVALIEGYQQQGSNEQVMSNILQEIEQVARGLGLNISDLKPQRVREQAFFNQFSISLRIDSSLPEIVKFIHAVQSRPHNFDVQDLRFDKSSRRNEDALKTTLVLQKTLVP